ncbi:MAG: insulinase family protein [Taibaiella sp.]|nr:insulinase family protein [Taibaiella sp.]
MFSIKKILSASLLAVSFFSATGNNFAQNGNYEWKEKVSNGYKYRYVTNDPTQTRFYTLPNGLSVILSVDRTQPRIQSFIAVKAGSKTDPATNTGLAHYLEHMLFKGTDKFGTLDYQKEKGYLDEISRLYEVYNKTTDETQRKLLYRQIDSVSGIASTYAIANEYDKMVANMGAQRSNAFTSFEQTVYMEDIPSNALDKYLHLQAERFRNPVLRIFHTELEAVYEEKNISLDDDDDQAIELFFDLIFPNHNYGQQTTIGTIDHLKNPSLIEIQKYYEKYYVPNNMGIIMCGDFNPDEVIAKIDRSFGYMKPRKVDAYRFTPEKDIMQPVSGEVYGPKPESVLIGYRFPGASSEDAKLLNLVGQILTNGSAGIFDLNLVQQQKLLSAGAFPYQLIDYSMLILQGHPSEGQDLDEVKSLMLAEIENLKKGNFSDDLIPSIVNNYKKSLIETYESYTSRAYALMDNFTTELDWKDQAEILEEMAGITKQDIIAFANKYLNNNYVYVYKRKGEKKNVVKVEKPTITPISINEKDQSPFMVENITLAQNEIQPVWIDYQKDMNKSQVGPFEVFSVENKTNELFNLYYYYEIGKWDSKILPIAADFVNFIGTETKSPNEIAKEFYNLATSFHISVNDENTYVVLNGLNENLEQSMAYMDDLLAHAKADPAIWEAYKQRLVKSRMNAKENKSSIMTGLINYAKYGQDNPFNNVLTDEQLNELDAERLVNEIKNLLKYPHRILYYGPSAPDALASVITKIHKSSQSAMKLPPKKVYKELPTENSTVLFADYKMVQADITWVRNGSVYNDDMSKTIALFNQYFGGGMGSIVFQTIRESKALAYSSYAYIGMPKAKNRNFSTIAFVGTQADKFNDAAAAMNELLTTLPQSGKNLESARSGLLKSMAAERINKDDIIFSYLSAEKMGRNNDIRKSIYEGVPGLGLKELTAFHNQEMNRKPFIYCIVGDKEKVRKEDMEQLGPVRVLDLKTIFGY